MKASRSISPEIVREHLRYEPDTGLFYWRKRAQGRVKSYIPVGNINKNGYRMIGLLGKYYFASRLAWAYVHGVWPDHIVDHINRNRSDDRISNLRAATPSQNSANSYFRGARSGFKGVYKNKKRWSSHVRKDGKLYYLGIFDTPELAYEAYKAKAEELFGEYAFPRRISDFGTASSAYTRPGGRNS